MAGEERIVFNKKSENTNDLNSKNKFAKREKLQVDAIVISDGEEICQKDRDGIPIYHLSELPLEKDNTTFIFAIEEKNISLLKNNAEKAGYEKFL